MKDRQTLESCRQKRVNTMKGGQVYPRTRSIGPLKTSFLDSSWLLKLRVGALQVTKHSTHHTTRKKQSLENNAKLRTA